MSTAQQPDPLADKAYLEDLRRHMAKFATLQLRDQALATDAVHEMASVPFLPSTTGTRAGGTGAYRSVGGRLKGVGVTTFWLRTDRARATILSTCAGAAAVLVGHARTCHPLISKGRPC